MISDLINLFLSGFIFMTIYNWLTNTQMELYLIGLWSLFVNAFIKTFYSALHSIIFIEKDFNESVKIIIYIITSVVMSILCVVIYNSTVFRNLLIKINKKTVHRDVFEDVIDYKKKTIMYVFMKESDYYYTGEFKLYEEKGHDSYIVLINYMLCDKDTCDEITNSTQEKTAALINLQDIERIELFYEDDSEIWEWLNKVDLEKTRKKRKKRSK